MECFNSKSGHNMFKAYKDRLAYSGKLQLLKCFITKVLEYKAKELNLYALLCVP